MLNQDQDLAQGYLFIPGHEDDKFLIEAKDAAWFIALLTLDWREFRLCGAQYYQALYEFNQEAIRRGITLDQLLLDLDFGGESREAAERRFQEDRKAAEWRLQKERPTGGNKGAPIIYQVPSPPDPKKLLVGPEQIAPGIVPNRLAGRKPKDFFALIKAFLGANLLGMESSAENVARLLSISPPYVRACGFTFPQASEYRHSDVPCLRKLEQFDEIMSIRGIWHAARVAVVRKNLSEKVVEVEKRAAGDTTHYLAASAFVLVQVDEEKSMKGGPAQGQGGKPSKQPSVKEGKKKGAGRRRKKCKPKGPKKSAREARKKDKKPRRKSQSRVTKNCRCKDWDKCPHDWVLADPGAGTVVKGGVGGKRRHWSHKASLLGLSVCGVPLDAVAMTDGATHDSRALIPHLKRLFAIYPEVHGLIDEIVLDSAYDDKNVREIKIGEYTLRIRAVPNTRSLKTRTDGLPKGMASLTPTGVLQCLGGFELPYLGTRPSSERYLYGPPVDREGRVACATCPFRQQCCRRDSNLGRHVTIPFGYLPAINSQDPSMAKRFRRAIGQRTSIERAIKRLKMDLGSPQLTRRGHAAFQAHMDKSLLALHLLLRM